MQTISLPVVCFSESHNSCLVMRGLVSAWRTLFDLVRPDLLVCDHSPTALAAARGYPFKRAILGTGFFCPPRGEHLPALRSGVNNAEIADSEKEVLAQVNALLERDGVRPLATLSDLYRDVDETILTTFAELDHFGPREEAHYWGAWPAGVGANQAIDWPDGPGPRVYGYLKSFHALEPLLERLAELRLPTVIVVDGIERRLQERFASSTMQFLEQPIDATQAAKWCDIAILNATHGMLVAMLLAGRPTLNIPIQMEQRLLSLKVVELRAGVAASANEPQETIKALDYVIENRSRLACAAGEFANRYRHFDAERQMRRLVERLEEML